MKLLVAIKRVPDHDMPLRLRADGSGIDAGSMRMVMNPFDETALEAALQLRETGIASEVVAVSCGAAACNETLKTALALGADRALLVESEEELEALGIAKLLCAVAQREQVQLVLCGKQGSDSDAAEVPPMLAALLGWAQATAVSDLRLEAGQALLRREIEGGQEHLVLKLPAVLSADLRLNQPRYVSLQGSMQARKKTITVLTPNELQVSLTPHLRTLKLSEAPARKAGMRVASVAELVARLQQEAKVL